MSTITSIKETLGFHFAMSADDVGMLLASDARAAFQALVEVHARQTEDERATKGTSHKNKFGFSKKHCTRGAQLAELFLKNPEALEAKDVHEACQIAYAYRQQTWMICLGAVPTNSLDLRKK